MDMVPVPPSPAAGNLYIYIPDGKEGAMEDRRKSSRMSVDCSAKITTSKGSMEGGVKNVSSTDAFIQCKKALSVMKRCLLKITLPNGHVGEFRVGLAGFRRKFKA